MSHQDNEKAWLVPLVLLLFCAAAVCVASIITMSVIDIPPPAYSQPAVSQGTSNR